MDFRFTEEQDALRELAREILENEISPERLKESEARGEFLDREAWARLAESNLLGLAVPEAQGGMGMGFLELCILLVEVGRKVRNAFGLLRTVTIPLTRPDPSADETETAGVQGRATGQLADIEGRQR